MRQHPSFIALRHSDGKYISLIIDTYPLGRLDEPSKLRSI